MHMVVIVAVSPGVEWEVMVNAEDLAKEGVQLHGLEEGEVGHVVELEEVPHVKKGLKWPANNAKTRLNQHNHD